jgi:hypothetical protein
MTPTDDQIADVAGQDSAASVPDRALLASLPEPVPVSALPGDDPSRLDNGPGLWAAILAKMPPGAIIAGGAVRDWFLGVEPKDIDIFMGTHAALPPTADTLDNDGWDTIAAAPDPRCGFSRIDVDFERNAEYEAMTGIALVSRGMCCGWPCDAVVIDGPCEPGALIAGFDFGITRCYFDGELHDTIWARCDREAVTVTLLLDDRPERAAIRFDRFNERHGGRYQLVRPARDRDASLAEDALARLSPEGVAARAEGIAQ